ncbi:MAG: glycosyltransferase family 4 protein [Candidatus Komeilibacteria bacterium]|nr:glycosyltransferase family 4 protein [Candidatus Komeilibacteria bacterium]
MKISLITMEYPPQTGGVGNYYYGLVRALERSGFSVDVQIIPAMARWFQVWQVIKKCRADIIWVGQILPIGTAAWLNYLLTKKPYFVSLHGFDINIAHEKKSWLTKQILQSAEFMTVNSLYTKGRLPAVADDKAVLVYPCPHIKTSPADPIAEWRQKLDIKGPVLLTLARLVPRKGYDKVIRLMPQLVRRYPSLQYLIVGRGPDHKRLESLVTELGVEANVKILTKIDDRAAAALYGLCDIFLMPAQTRGSDAEGFGIVYLEAALAAKPAVATVGGGVNEAVVNDETGFVCRPEELLSRLEKLLADPALRQRLGETGRRRVQTQFTYEKQAPALIDRLRSLMIAGTDFKDS